MISRYDHYAPHDLRETVDYAVRDLTPLIAGFDSIAVRGVSGLLVGSPVALALGKPLAVVRKPSEVAHASGIVNRAHAGNSYIVIDDFVSSGATVREIQLEMAWRTNAVFTGFYTYLYRKFVPACEMKTHYSYSTW